MSDRFKMVGVDATTNTTNVIQFQTFWDRTLFPLVIDDVSAAHFAINFDAAITVGVDRSKPNETTRIRLGNTQSFKPIFQRNTVCAHIRRPLR